MAGYVIDPDDVLLVVEALRLYAEDVRAQPSGDPAAQLLLSGAAQRAVALADEIEASARL